MKQFSTLIFLVFSLTAMAQQEAHYTWFMFNHQYYNPAYVGSRNTASFTGIHRSQWLGFEGAPSSQLVSFQTPIMRNRAGVGGSISRSAIGVSYSWFGSAAYSYNIKLTPDLNLRLGLQTTLEYVGIRFSDPSIVTVSQNDPSLGDGSFDDKYVANVGFGAFMTYKDLFYIGASSPQVYPNELGLNPDVLKSAQAFPHRYITVGAAIPLTEEVELMPNILVKWVDQAPRSADLNFNVRYQKKILAGLTYRTGGNKNGDSVDALLYFQFNQKIGAGLSYDFTLSDIRDYQSGTVELVVKYDFRDERGNLENPRYFKKK